MIAAADRKARRFVSDGFKLIEWVFSLCTRRGCDRRVVGMMLRGRWKA